jgi:uncharacterized membrane protein
MLAGQGDFHAHDLGHAVQLWSVARDAARDSPGCARQQAEQPRGATGAPMTLEPLFEAPPLVQLHAVLAVGAIALGVVQLAAPKGKLPHRTLGWTWISLIAMMLIVAFFNHDILPWDPFGPAVCCRGTDSCARGSASCASIHLISVYFLLALPYGALHARRHDLIGHRNAMLWLFLGVLLVGTVLTFVPHRIMHDVVFGP